METNKKLINLWRKGYEYSNGKTVCRGKPMIQNIESTNACGMKCLMCPRNHMTRKIGFMNIELFEKIVKQLKWNSRVALHHFGDPLLHPKIGEMFKICNKYGIKSAISTNPSSLTKKTIEEIFDGGLDILHLSLDGATKETYEKIRGGSANYQKALEGIELFLKEREKRNAKKPFTTIAIIKMKETKDEILAFEKKWRDRKGIDEVQVKEFITWDGTMDEINKLQEEVSHKAKRTEYYPCLWLWNKLTVLWDGRVVICCFDSDAKCVVGDLNTQTLEEIWNSEKMQKLREMHINNKFPNKHICSLCKEREGFVPSKLFPLNLIFQKRLNFLRYYRYN
ncbi:radical SAM protein [Candidatus Pacearchaeota archaeon]|nr:radical SAM protein [Candidatus Pacearchaeota archaeon]